MTDQEIAATIGEYEREKGQSAFDLDARITGHLSCRHGFGGHGALRLSPPTKYYYALSHPHAGLVAVGELDAGFFQGVLPDLIATRLPRVILAKPQQRIVVDFQARRRNAKAIQAQRAVGAAHPTHHAPETQPGLDTRLKREDHAAIPAIIRPGRNAGDRAPRNEGRGNAPVANAFG